MNKTFLRVGETLSSYFKHKLSCFFGYHRKDYACMVCGLQCRCGNSHRNYFEHATRGNSLRFDDLIK